MKLINLSIVVLIPLLVAGFLGCEISTIVWTDECQVKIINRADYSVIILWDGDEYPVDSGETITLSFVSLGLHIVEIKTVSGRESVMSEVYKINVDSDFELIVNDDGLIIIN